MHYALNRRLLVTALATSCTLLPSNPAMSITGSSLYFYADVTTESCLQLAKDLKEMDARITAVCDQVQGQRRPAINVHVHSSGGSLLNGLYLFDLVRSLQTPVHTHVEGLAASAATLLTVAGDQRSMSKHSMMLVHQPSQTVSGDWNYVDFRDQHANMQRCVDAMVDIYVERTKLEKKDVLQMLGNEQFLSAQECLEYGFVDEIL